MKKRILFVEDDPLVSKLYAMVLADDGGAWEVTVVPDGQQALRAMEQAPFDVVVSDMRMPGMSGTELLNEVKRRHPRTSRIILSALSDKEQVVRSLDGIHQFIAKPFDANVLKSTLARVCGLDAYLKDDRLRVLIGQLGTLPSFPTLYVEIMKELDSPNSLVESVAAIIAKDPGMTAKMLQIVNSVAFGLERKVSSPFEAVEYLGFNTVRSLALSAHIFSRFEKTNLRGLSIDELWNHSMNTGTLARLVMRLEHAEAADAEDAYIAGILHDVGKLLLADNVPEQFGEALARAAARGIPLHEAEQEILGATHAGAAAYLLGLWGLPAAIVEAVAFHHAPRQSDLRAFGPLAAVHAANVLEHELAKTASGGRSAEFDTDYLAAIGCKERLEEWRAEAGRRLTAQKDAPAGEAARV
jgi:HD-like signal output (HDOD) protein